MADLNRYWGRTALYRLFDTEGVLLYVGIAVDPEARWEKHAATQEWWHLVAEKTTQWFDTRVLAADAEIEAIRTAKPRFNLMHSTGLSPFSTRTVGVVAKATSATAFQANNARYVAVARDARFELGELPITYIEHRGGRVAALVPPWLAQWAERHADEVLASLRAESSDS